jgi:hypothetical protein
LEVASSEVESHERGWVPRARWGLTRGGAKPSSEAGVSWRGACPSSETEVCPRGAEAWAMGLSLPWAAAVRGVICSLWV